MNYNYYHNPEQALNLTSFVMSLTIIIGLDQDPVKKLDSELYESTRVNSN